MFVIRNNFRVTKKFLITKFDCITFVMNSPFRSETDRRKFQEEIRANDQNNNFSIIFGNNPATTHRILL